MLTLQKEDITDDIRIEAKRQFSCLDILNVCPKQDNKEKDEYITITSTDSEDVMRESYKDFTIDTNVLIDLYSRTKLGSCDNNFFLNYLENYKRINSAKNDRIEVYNLFIKLSNKLD